MTGDSKADRRAARTERLREALRDNLRRRKAQARGRAGDGGASPAEEAGAGTAREVDDPDEAG